MIIDGTKMLADNLTVAGGTTDSDTYDLTGRKVRQMNRHGLYISGGKKVLAY